MKSWLLLSFLLFAPNLLSVHLISIPAKPVKKELFDAAMAKKIRSMNDLEKYIDSLQAANGIKFESVQYANLVSDVVRNRFYHCYSYYSLKENWIAALCGKFIWQDLSAIVIPDDILKYSMGGCSQQCIVLMEFFRRKRIDFKKVSYDHHFAMEAKLNDSWIYFDPDMEPPYTDGTRYGLNYLLRSNHLEELYKNIISENTIKIMLGHPHEGKINEYPAPKAKFFHVITHFLSHWLWIIPLSIFLFPFCKRFLHIS